MITTSKETNDPLDLVTVDKRLLDELSSQGLLSRQARKYALSLVYPGENWGVWTALILSVLGISLILAGVIYFFAFNWAKIDAWIKLCFIELSILVVFLISNLYGLKKLSGKISILCAAVLVGVFFAVFGQIYQTGADAYTLFFTWAILILPWTLVGEFAPLWLTWLIVSNVAIIFYWFQAAPYSPPLDFLLFPILVVFNFTFLILREILAFKNVDWLKHPWTREILIFPILTYLLIPTIAYITEPHAATLAMKIGALLSIVMHIALYLIYRFKLRDIVALVFILFSVCIAVETAVFKGLSELFGRHNGMKAFSIGVATLFIFSLVIIQLRMIAQKMEAGSERK